MGLASKAAKYATEYITNAFKVLDAEPSSKKAPVLGIDEQLSGKLNVRLENANKSSDASSILPAPGKFFTPGSKSYKGPMAEKFKEQGIDTDLTFGNYIELAPNSKPTDATNKIFQNLYITARTSEKLTSGGKQNKSVARAKPYSGPPLTLSKMKDNYKKATGNSSMVVKTNLLQPERFKVTIDDKDFRLNHPIIAVEKGKQHYYTLDTQFVGPVLMKRNEGITTRTNKRTGVKRKELDSPNLRPETVGDVKLGTQVGTIRVGKKEHPLYDYIEVDATPAASEKGRMSYEDKFNKGGNVSESFNKGGTMALQEQMSMFDEGGMLDEGDTIDPVSGNDVPVGALKEEVRDDVSANVSPGEFVVSAATVRFHGLDKFMKLRDEAMQGMARMEAIGQMGNSNSSELDPDTPFSQEDLVIVMGGPPEEGMPSDDKPMEANRGGSVLPTAAELGEEDPQELMYADGGDVNPSLIARSLNLGRTTQKNPGEEGFQALVPKFDRIVEYVNGQGEITFVSIDTNGNPMGYVDPDSRPVDASSRAAKDSKDTDVYNTSKPSNTFVPEVDQPRGPDDNKIEAPDFGDGSWDINFVGMDLGERIKESFRIMARGGIQHTGKYNPETGEPILVYVGGFQQLVKSVSPVLGLNPVQLLAGLASGIGGAGAYLRKEFERGPELTIQRSWDELTDTEKEELEKTGIIEENYDSTINGLVAKFPGEDIREKDDGLGIPGRTYLENLDPIGNLDWEEEKKKADSLPKTAGGVMLRDAQEKARKLTEQYKKELPATPGDLPNIPSFIGRGTTQDTTQSSGLGVEKEEFKDTYTSTVEGQDDGDMYEQTEEILSKPAEGLGSEVTSEPLPDIRTEMDSIQGLEKSLNYTSPIDDSRSPKNILPTPSESKEIDRQIKIANDKATAISPPKQDFTKVPTEDLLERFPMGTPPQPELDIAGDITPKAAGPTGGTYEPPVASRNTDPIKETNFPPGQGPQPEAIPVTRSIGAPLSTTEEKSTTSSGTLSPTDLAIPKASPRQEATITTGALSPALQEAIDIANNTYGPGHMAIPAGVVPTKQQLEWMMQTGTSGAAWDTVAEKQARENHAKGILSDRQLDRELGKIRSVRIERGKPSAKARLVRDPSIVSGKGKGQDEASGGEFKDTLGKTSFSSDYDVPDRDPFGFGDPKEKYEGGKSELDYFVEEEEEEEDPYENHDPMGSTTRLHPDKPTRGGTTSGGTTDGGAIGGGGTGGGDDTGTAKGGLITRKKYNRGGSVTDNTLNLYEGSLVNTSLALGNRRQDAEDNRPNDVNEVDTNTDTTNTSFDPLNPEARNLQNPSQQTLVQKHAGKYIGHDRETMELTDPRIEYVLRKYGVEWRDKGVSRLGDVISAYKNWKPGQSFMNSTSGGRGPDGKQKPPPVVAALDGLLSSRMTQNKRIDPVKNPEYMTLTGKWRGLTVDEVKKKYGEKATLGDVVRGRIKADWDIMNMQAQEREGSPYAEALRSYDNLLAKGKEQNYANFTRGKLWRDGRFIDLNKIVTDPLDIFDIAKTVLFAQYGRLPTKGYYEPITELKAARPEKWDGFKEIRGRIAKQYPASAALWEDPRPEVTANKGALIQKPKKKKNKTKAKSKRRGLASASY